MELVLGTTMIALSALVLRWGLPKLPTRALALRSLAQHARRHRGLPGDLLRRTFSRSLSGFLLSRSFAGVWAWTDM